MKWFLHLTRSEILVPRAFMSVVSNHLTNNLSLELNTTAFPYSQLTSPTSKGVCQIVPRDFSRERPVETTPEFMVFRLIHLFPYRSPAWRKKFSNQNRDWARLLSIFKMRSHPLHLTVRNQNFIYLGYEGEKSPCAETFL